MPSTEQYMSILLNVGPIVLMFVIFYFFLIRPQRKRDKADREMKSSLQVGDKISTIGGIIGRIISIKDDVFLIETSADRTKLEIYRFAIRGKETEIV